MFLCQLGSNAQLSLAELESVFHKDKVEWLNQNAAIIDVPDELMPDNLQTILGGTVKIGSILQNKTDLTQDEIENLIAKLLQNETSGKLTFAVAELDRDHLPKLDLTKIKRILSQKSSNNIRYIEGVRAGLSAAILLHQKDIVEIIVCRDRAGKTVIGKTLSVQDIDAWSLRDRGKPEVSRKRGLLTPKVSRIMVNLSLGPKVFALSQPNKLSLLDPFCGAGTIPFEAITSGFNKVIGTDLSQEAITQAQANFTWFQSEFPQDLKYTKSVNFFASDATQLKQKIDDNSISHIVTEPFLGKQTPEIAQIADIARGLEKLFLGAFKSWLSILKPLAKIVIIFPNWSVLKNPKNWQSLVSKLETYGYFVTATPIIYGRPGAKVMREIWQFELRK